MMFVWKNILRIYALIEAHFLISINFTFEYLQCWSFFFKIVKTAVSYFTFLRSAHWWI